MLMVSSPLHAASLAVTVDGVRNDEGDIRVAVCTKAEFLQATCEHTALAPARTGAVTLTVDGLETGVWAVQVFHDENRNGRIDTNFFGIPTEGIGFSNGAQIRMGPPAFDDAAIRLAPGGGMIHVSLRYF